MPKGTDVFLPVSQKGQTLIIVILIMVVALTVGLSLASRNVVNLKLTTEEENSQKALAAAEAGIEQSLINKDATGQAFGSATIFQVTNQTLQGNQFFLNNGAVISKDDGLDVTLTKYYPNDPTLLYKAPFYSGTLTFYWGSPGDTCDPNPAINTMSAIEIILITANPDKNHPQLTQQAFDPCTLRRGYNNFAIPSSGSYSINGQTFGNQIALSVSNGLFVHLIPIYANTVMAVNGTQTLPPQGTVITSTGAAGATQRKIQYYQANDSVPSEFFYSLFSSK